VTTPRGPGVPATEPGALAPFLARVSARLADLLPQLVRVLARHWLLLANIVLTLQALLPYLAPALMQLGYLRAGHNLYSLYVPLCHQLPERSFFLFGLQYTYSLRELESLLGVEVPLRYIGDSIIGYKTTVCQRDVATYMTMWLAGLLFVGLRNRLRPLSLKIFVTLCIPIAIDGLGQLVGVWTSTPLTRVVSGGLFGLACVWLAFPLIEVGMRDVQRLSY